MTINILTGTNLMLEGVNDNLHLVLGFPKCSCNNFVTVDWKYDDISGQQAMITD